MFQTLDHCHTFILQVKKTSFFRLPHGASVTKWFKAYVYQSQHHLSLQFKPHSGQMLVWDSLLTPCGVIWKMNSESTVMSSNDVSFTTNKIVRFYSFHKLSIAITDQLHLSENCECRTISWQIPLYNFSHKNIFYGNKLPCENLLFKYKFVIIFSIAS